MRKKKIKSFLNNLRFRAVYVIVRIEDFAVRLGLA